MTAIMRGPAYAAREFGAMSFPVTKVSPMTVGFPLTKRVAFSEVLVIFRM